MKLSLVLLVILGIAITIEAVPQRRKPGRRGDSSEENGEESEESSEERGPGRRKGGKGGKGGLKGPLKSCKDQIPEDFECPDGTKPVPFPDSACADLNVGDEAPSKSDIENPCEDLEEDDEVEMTGCLVCAEKGRPPTVADPVNGIDFTVSTVCKQKGRKLKPDKKEAECEVTTRE